MTWYFEVLKNYAEFEGRADREEFWQFMLINLMIDIPLYFTHYSMWAVYTAAVLLPTLAVSVRRLHDIGRTGWWAMGLVIPVVQLAVLLLLLQDGNPGFNRYGFNPHDVIA